MVITAYTFIFSVISLYTFYRYFVQHNEFFKDLSWLHFQWQFFYLISMLMIIYTANLVTNEVKFIEFFVFAQFRFCMVWFFCCCCCCALVGEEHFTNCARHHQSMSWFECIAIGMTVSDSYVIRIEKFKQLQFLQCKFSY